MDMWKSLYISIFNTFLKRRISNHRWVDISIARFPVTEVPLVQKAFLRDISLWWISSLDNQVGFVDRCV